MRLSVAGFVVRAVAIVVAFGVLGLGGVLDPVHAVLLACVVLAGLVLYAWGPDASGTPWPEHPSAGRGGGRGGVSDLAWQVSGQGGRVSGRIVHRTRELAASRLALVGVDFADPGQRSEVERLLGVRVVAGLLSDQPPNPRTLQIWLDAIDRLDERTTR